MKEDKIDNNIISDSNFKNEVKITGLNYDLANILAQRCNFSLQLEEVDLYGSMQDDGSWTGLIEKLMMGDLDMGIADVSITKERASVVDFSIGFQRSEYVLYMRRPGAAWKLQTFYEGFSTGFWLCLMATIISLTVFLCFVSTCISWVSSGK